MITTAAVALLAGSAFAQAPAQQPLPTPPTAQQPTSPPPAAMEKDKAPAPMARDATLAGKHQIVTEQKADQLLATKFRGTDVIGPNNEKIGNVNDILFDKDAKVVAYVIGVGGFLGIGSKDVALTPSSFQLQPASDKEELKLKLAMSKDELQKAAEFKPHKAAAPTTGQAPRDRAPAIPAPPRQ